MCRKLTADAFRHLMIDAYTYLEEHHGLGRGLAKKGVTTHGLRCAAATRLLELGCSFEVIASIAGHETIEMMKKCIEEKRDAKLAIAVLDAGTAAQRSNGSDKPAPEK